MFKPSILLMTTGFMTTLSWGAAGLDRPSSPETPARLSPQNASFRPVTPLVTPISALTDAVTTSGKSPLTPGLTVAGAAAAPCIAVGPRLVRADAIGTAERSQFAHCYAQAVHNQQFQTASQLVSQLTRQLQWANSAAAEAAQLSLAELGGVARQVGQALNLEHTGELTAWQLDPEFNETSFTVTIGELYALALVWQEAGRVMAWDPMAVSERVAAACDHRIWRWLRVQQLATKYITPANIAWLQQALVRKLCPSVKT